MGMNDDTAKPTETAATGTESEDMQALSGRISSWRDFADRVSAVMAMAAAEPGLMTLSDRDFSHWPLGQREVVDAFQQWVLGSAREIHCVVLAAGFDAFMRTHPRWVNWRKLWAHRVLCRQAPDDLATAVPTVFVLHGRLALRIVEPLVGRGVWTRDPAVMGDWLTEVDVISQRSHDALPPTTLGI
jgi:hypothetical protein